MSDADSVAFTVAFTDFDDAYTPGASVAAMFAAPAAAGVTQVAAFPPWSVATEHVVAPPHAESCVPLVADHPIVAPLTAVTPSAASTRTLTGFAACTPTGVVGFDPLIKTILSLSAAPYNSAPVIVVAAPLTGSLNEIFCHPSE